jgi:hypothetical protein
MLPEEIAKEALDGVDVDFASERVAIALSFAGVGTDSTTGAGEGRSHCQGSPGILEPSFSSEGHEAYDVITGGAAVAARRDLFYVMRLYVSPRAGLVDAGVAD